MQRGSSFHPLVLTSFPWKLLQCHSFMLRQIKTAGKIEVLLHADPQFPCMAFPGSSYPQIPCYLVLLMNLEVAEQARNNGGNYCCLYFWQLEEDLPIS